MYHPIFAVRMTGRGQKSFWQKSYSEIFPNFCRNDY
jgi:hypothetical protein